MTAVTTDIDIDFADRDAALSTLPHIAASRLVDGLPVRHQTSVYFQDIPCDPFTGLASIPHTAASQLGYFKIDFLNNSIYGGIRDEDHLDELIAREPEWSLLEDRDIVSLLVQIGQHFGAVQRIRPRSIDDLAIVLALIRPGKKHLMAADEETIRREVWANDHDDNYSFKRSHSIAYATSIVVQMNLLVEQMAASLQESDGFTDA